MKEEKELMTQCIQSCSSCAEKDARYIKLIDALVDNGAIVTRYPRGRIQIEQGNLPYASAEALLSFSEALMKEAEEKLIVMKEAMEELRAALAEVGK